MATAKKTAKKKTAPKSSASAKKPAPKKKAPAKKKESASSPKSATTKKSSSGSKASSLNPLGKKFTCHTCGTKFYDLNKEEKICPKCGADQNKRPATKSRVRPRVEEEEFPEDTMEEDADVGFEDEEGGIVEEPLEEEEDEEEEEE
ncbi:TIGR02300 family protein [Leptospira wolffii]|uniref:TIGR02300 family protein n=1 Tax=Leptospira wolffii TaxID=409998 RepID=A0A2M9ZB73_9LEPT|nr:TIGR02300 family protein [Leptospira wolffii]EPG66940.1 TIGR02300-like family protein [Leptospira wolffii serovar Khorat str. Khorat-H2]PJZ65706.1 TIGR02300 family protein [Leptospira wolffii]TGK56077.1 TIGR02300 family protein [Leptospira wolffii]TGK72123.1 TIGR02300 family protein [Leptospira wolffii]TGK77427.1 TIGR02300 family protein [Leptospira wolffii]